MEMFLMVLCMSMFGLAVTAAAFGAAARPQQAQPEAEPAHEPVVMPAPARFFADDVVLPVAAAPIVTGAAIPATLRPSVSIEALLLQIENHVRLEQAAATSFVEYPTSAMLHTRTASPLLH